MKKINNHNPLKVLGSLALFIMLSIAVYAQDRTMPPNPSAAGDAQDTSAFNMDARHFADQLAQQTGLSAEKTDEITQILIDYHNDIAEARQDYFGSRQDADNNGGMYGDNADTSQDVTGGQSREEISRDDADQPYTNVPPELMSEYRKADEKADNDIIDVFENEAQKERYLQVKDQWWNDVKDKVFSSVSQTSGHQMK